MALFDEQTGGLITFWKSKTAITDLVGTGSNARIRPGRAKQGWTGQAITFNRAGGFVSNDLGGVSGHRLTVLHVYCYGETPTEADALAEAVKGQSQDYRGDMSGTYVHHLHVTEAPDDGADNAIDGSDAHRYWVRLILRISHGE